MRGNASCFICVIDVGTKKLENLTCDLKLCSYVSTKNTLKVLREVGIDCKQSFHDVLSCLLASEFCSMSSTKRPIGRALF